MSVDTRELIEICERLPAAQRSEVTAFARSLLAERRAAIPAVELADRWIATAGGAATAGLTTDQILAMTRGER